MSIFGSNTDALEHGLVKRFISTANISEARREIHWEWMRNHFGKSTASADAEQETAPEQIFLLRFTQRENKLS